MSHAPDALLLPDTPPADPVFQAPWEARVFALAVSLSKAGLFTWGEWNAALVARVKASPCGEATYDLWLDTLEDMLISRTAADRSVLADLREAWRAAAERTPHGQPIELDPGTVKLLVAGG